MVLLAKYTGSPIEQLIRARRLMIRPEQSSYSRPELAAPCANPTDWHMEKPRFQANSARANVPMFVFGT